MIECKKCKQLRPISDYHADSSRSTGHRSECIPCFRQRRREIYSPEKRKAYETANKDRYIASRRKTYTVHKEKILRRNADYRKERIQNDPFFKFVCNLRTCIRNALYRNNFSKCKRSHKLVGADFEVVWRHLISTALSRYGIWCAYDDYHIDHIRPMCTAKTREQAEALCHYTNLQLLTPEDNLKKSWKYQPKVGVTMADFLEE